MYFGSCSRLRSQAFKESVIGLAWLGLTKVSTDLSQSAEVDQFSGESPPTASITCLVLDSTTATLGMRWMSS